MRPNVQGQVGQRNGDYPPVAQQPGEKLLQALDVPKDVRPLPFFNGPLRRRRWISDVLPCSLRRKSDLFLAVLEHAVDFVVEANEFLQVSLRTLSGQSAVGVEFPLELLDGEERAPEHKMQEFTPGNLFGASEHVMICASRQDAQEVRTM